jgi:HD-GYP domain-containing protein (c-di-GMP phosphodiesterase class II)
VLERHPQLGHRILVSLGLEQVADVVLHHHERWDGGGYPGGLSRNEIPLASRIVLAADAFDAITSDRPYAGARSAFEAQREIERCAGTQLDPEVVEAVLSALDGHAVGV